MPIPAPHPGLVISYAYLWHEQHRSGQEEGVKNRPCAIIMVRQDVNTQTAVGVLPITHSAPQITDEAIELPPGLKKHLGLDDDRSWIMLSEMNEFIWPGPDLMPVPGIKPSKFDYGVIPPKFFRQIQEQFFAYVTCGKAKLVPRSE